VREQVELLEHHPHLAADGIEVADVIRKGDAIDGDRTLLEVLKAVEGADEGALAGARGAHDHHHLALAHLQLSATQGVKTVGVPLLDATGLDHQGTGHALTGV
jgi:hypothetical protein